MSASLVLKENRQRSPHEESLAPKLGSVLNHFSQDIISTAYYQSIVLEKQYKETWGLAFLNIRVQRACRSTQVLSTELNSYEWCSPTLDHNV